MTGQLPDLPAGAFVIDPVFGRVVVVPDRLLLKVRGKHGGYYAPRREEILGAVASCERTGPSSSHAERQWYARRSPADRLWPFVVVDYAEQSTGVVVTAFPRRRLPRLP